MGWLEFGASLAAFFGTHFLPSQGGLRDRLIARFGRRLYFSVYGAVSLAVVAWVIIAAGRAPHVDLWWQHGWHRWVPVLAMPVAVLLAVLGLGVRYPFTLGGRRKTVFDPAHPGITALTRHALLWSLTLWSLAHLFPNGDVAHVILFGGFAALSLGAMWIFDQRAKAAFSPSEWDAVRRATAILSLRPLGDRRWWQENRRLLFRSVLISVLIYAAAYLLHEPVIGVTPAPF